jgi:hypothetical protein
MRRREFITLIGSIAFAANVGQCAVGDVML